jgi:hypothetical protein
MNRTDLQVLADLRIAEAAALVGLPAPLSDGAYYLAGYAVELGLKACIAKLNQQFDWPEKAFVASCHTHDILALVRLAGLETDRARDAAANPQLDQNWTVVKDWNERSRYERHSLAEAQKLMTAIVDPIDGVLPWIKARW